MNGWERAHLVREVRQARYGFILQSVAMVATVIVHLAGGWSLMAAIAGLGVLSFFALLWAGLARWHLIKLEELR